METTGQLAVLTAKLDAIRRKIKELEGIMDITDRVAASFHLGRVGGSGRNTYRLNKKRERALEQTIERAKILTDLYQQERVFEKQIEDIQSGGPERRKTTKLQSLLAKAEYWKQLKAGDMVSLFTGNQIKISKKNKKSILSEHCKWTAAEIIGKEAAALL